MRKLLIRGCFLTLLAAPMAVADGLPDLGEVSQAEFSPLLEKRLGEAFMREIRLREPAYVTDPEINGYLNRLGKRLASNSEQSRQEFEFFAIADSTLNAFAMPGGYIGVHTGLISAAQSESELAGVLAHEISHVTQRHIARGIAKQSQSEAASWLAIALAALAARSNPQLAQGIWIGGQAAGVQNQLSFSRDFEREADRIGLLLLERSGYDIRGMSGFFERLQKFSRLYEGPTSAPSYLRTHPLTTERLADMENRIQLRPYKQVPDTLDFLLVRAKIKASEGRPEDAVAEFDSQVKERKYSSAAAARYGLAFALWRARDYPAADAQVAELRRLKLASPMIESLAADIRLRLNDGPGAIKLLRAAVAAYPADRGIVYDLVDALLIVGQPQEALKVTLADLQAYTTDDRMHLLQAKTYAMLGKRLQQHRAQGEAYALQGQLNEAINQFEFAQKSPDGDFYEHSQVDARLRQLKRQREEELKQRRQQQ